MLHINNRSNTNSNSHYKHDPFALDGLILDLERSVTSTGGYSAKNNKAYTNKAAATKTTSNSVKMKSDLSHARSIFEENMKSIRLMLGDLDNVEADLPFSYKPDSIANSALSLPPAKIHVPTHNLETLMHDLTEFQIQHEIRLKETPDSVYSSIKKDLKDSPTTKNNLGDNMNKNRFGPTVGGGAPRTQLRKPAPPPAAVDTSKCAACGEQIKDQLVTALGKSWHYSHFLCTGCKAELARQNFYERDNAPYCEGCYQNSFSPKCSYCNQPILDRCITALDKPWHPEHFFCQGCTRPFDESSGFHERDGKPFCGDCYNDAFAQKCAGCSKPITSNYINAMEHQWHAACFVCRDCGSDFSTGNFYEVDGQPYCELHYHARRGSICITCKQPIAGKCISAMGRKFHPEHFTCSFCNGELAKGTFLVKEDKPYCNDCHTKLFMKQ